MGFAPLATAELLAVGTELLVGETRDTNSGDLAGELTALGVEVRRLSQLPDDLAVVVAALRAALANVDLVVTTGGLGPTPDDLTREAIAEVLEQTPAVDPGLEAWLRGLFERRGLRFTQTNLKQAWLIPGAVSLPNPHGTAPGWFAETAEGRVVIALPGPPREMRPMWRDHVLPILRGRGLGVDRAVETLRLTGIGESLLVDLVGEDLLRGSQPQVATYARVDAVDLRVSATGERGRTARNIVDAAVAEMLPRLEPYLFARGDEGWPEAVERRLAGRTLALTEIGMGGQLLALLGTSPLVVHGEMLRDRAPLPRGARDLRALARSVRDDARAHVALVVRARERRGDTDVSIAVATDRRTTQVGRRAFLAGDLGRRRAANSACAELWARLGSPTSERTAGQGDAGMGEARLVSASPSRPPSATR
jgi:nicotinamide-nucleotide amidase